MTTLGKAILIVQFPPDQSAQDEIGLLIYCSAMLTICDQTDDPKLKHIAIIIQNGEKHGHLRPKTKDHVGCPFITPFPPVYRRNKNKIGLEMLTDLHATTDYFCPYCPQ